MLDARVLTAVLATITALAFAIGGGSLDAENLKSKKISAPGRFSFNDMVPGSLGSISFFKKPEPENPVKAVFTAEDVSAEELDVKGAWIESGDINSVSFGGKKATSPAGINIYGFDGTVDPDRATHLKGSAAGFYSNGVNVSGSLRINQKANTSHLLLERVERSGIKLEKVSGTVDSNSSVTEIRESGRLKINSFSGDIRLYPRNGTFVFTGEVDRLEAGSFSFGS